MRTITLPGLALLLLSALPMLAAEDAGKTEGDSPPVADPEPSREPVATTEELREALVASQARVEELEQALAEAEVQIQELARPDIPLRATTREALLDDSIVLKLVSYHTEALRIRLAWTVAGTEQEKIVSLRPGVLKELGHEEGMPLRSGDEVQVFADGYRPMTVTIP